MSESWRSYDDALRDRPRGERILIQKQVSTPLLRALAGAISRRVDALCQEHRAALIRAGVEQFTDGLADVLAYATAAPLTFMHDEQRRHRDDDEGRR